MMSLRIILRAYKLKRAVKRLRRAKENSLRIHNGKRPRYPWYEELWTWFLDCLKNNFCKAFCPCCLHPQIRKEDGVNVESFFRSEIILKSLSTCIYIEGYSDMAKESGLATGDNGDKDVPGAYLQTLP
ncbi:hypothetical protein AVEN_186997-1 [Araneus ventricosus]|uniref:Uncharacterized protein n=1 Tax=Araneus ventricosus TaxID=182803 RepID=A0A4Y2H416_ARAVE|nr:hypothetical protein AVEN_186997-1 [Araneus ventricosus]